LEILEKPNEWGTKTKELAKKSKMIKIYATNPTNNNAQERECERKRKSKVKKHSLALLTLKARIGLNFDSS